MNDLDTTTFDRFAKRFARIERLVPDPPIGAGRIALGARDRGRLSPVAVIVGTALLLVATVGLAVIGSQTQPHPSPSPGATAVNVPLDSAAPAVVLEAYLRASEAGDCATARVLTMPLVLNANYVELCGATRLTAFSIVGDPLVVDPETVQMGTILTIAGTIPGTSTGTSADGLHGEYFLQRQSSGAWRVIQGYVQLPPSMLPTPAPPQAADPRLGGTGWTVTVIDGEPVSEPISLSFWGGPAGGDAVGDISSDCFFVYFTYTYDPNGSSFVLSPARDGEGSYAEGCSPALQSQYESMPPALRRISESQRPQPDRLELVDNIGTIMLGLLPAAPLPTPPPGGDCGVVPATACIEAATEAFNFGLNLQPGERIVSWRVRTSIYTACASPGLVPKFDVIFELANPTFEKIAVVGDAFGKLHACGDY